MAGEGPDGDDDDDDDYDGQPETCLKARVRYWNNIWLKMKMDSL